MAAPSKVGAYLSYFDTNNNFTQQEQLEEVRPDPYKNHTESLGHAIFPALPSCTNHTVISGPVAFRKLMLGKCCQNKIIPVCSMLHTGGLFNLSTIAKLVEAQL